MSDSLSELKRIATMNPIAAAYRMKELENKLAEAEKALRGLLNKVNAVTSWHRHGNGIDPGALDELANRQLEAEAALEKIRAGRG